MLVVGASLTYFPRMPRQQGIRKREILHILPGCSPEHRILRRRHVKQLHQTKSDVSLLTDKIIFNGVPGSTYAALTRRRLVCGCPSVATKRICLGAEGLPPFFFLGEGGLMASQ